MARSHLTPVSDDRDGAPEGEVVDIGRGADAAAWRMRQLQQEARALAREQVEALARDLAAIAVRAAEIADGGELYGVGVREIAARLAEDLRFKSQSLDVIASRDG